MTEEYLVKLGSLLEKTNFEKHHTHKEWDFYQSLYFASTVTTTIGYGHITPKTQPGRIFLIVFAVFGIPLNILALASVGEHITVAIFYFIRYFHQKLFHDKKISHINIKVMLVSVTIMVFMLFLGGFLYCSTEEWTYIDSIYYCFVAMATIGFGDLVPNHGKAPDTEREKGIWFLRALYLSVGLSLVSTVFTALSNAMEEINILLGRDNTWSPDQPGLNGKNKSNSPNSKHSSLESEKITYKHKIRKHGNTIWKYRLLQRLKRKHKENTNRAPWDDLFVDMNGRKTSRDHLTHSPAASFQSMTAKTPEVVVFTESNKRLIKSCSLDTYPNSSLLLLPVLSDNESASTKISTTSISTSPSLYHRNLIHSNLLIPSYKDTHIVHENNSNNSSPRLSRRHRNHKKIYRNHSAPPVRHNNKYNENSRLLLTTSPHKLSASPHNLPTSPYKLSISPHNLPTSPHKLSISPYNLPTSPHKGVRRYHSNGSPLPNNINSDNNNKTSTFNWTPNVMSELEYDIALNQC